VLAPGGSAWRSATSLATAMSNSDTILRAGHKEPRAGVTGQRAANAGGRAGGRTRGRLSCAQRAAKRSSPSVLIVRTFVHVGRVRARQRQRQRPSLIEPAARLSLPQSLLQTGGPPGTGAPLAVWSAARRHGSPVTSSSWEKLSLGLDCTNGAKKRGVKSAHFFGMHRCVCLVRLATSLQTYWSPST